MGIKVRPGDKCRVYFNAKPKTLTDGDFVVE
jgi:hypothetical protein